MLSPLYIGATMLGRVGRKDWFSIVIPHARAWHEVHVTEQSLIAAEHVGNETLTINSCCALVVELFHMVHGSCLVGVCIQVE